MAKTMISGQMNVTYRNVTLKNRTEQSRAEQRMDNEQKPNGIPHWNHIVPTCNRLTNRVVFPTVPFEKF